MTEKNLIRCPVCGLQSLVAHCSDTHPTCTWHACRNKACDAQLDLAKRTGHCIQASEGQPSTRRRVILPNTPQEQP